MRAAQDRVTETVHELVTVLQEHEKVTTEKLAEVNEIQKAHHAIQMEKVKSVISHFKRSVERGEGILQRNNAHEILQAGNTIIERLEELLKTTETQVDICKSLHLCYIIPNMRNIFNAIEDLDLGQLPVQVVATLTDPSQCVANGSGLKSAQLGIKTYFTVTTNDSEGSQCYSEEDLVTVTICSPAGEEEMNITNHKNGNYEVWYRTKHIGQHEIVVEVNGKSLSDRPWSFQVERPIYHCKAEVSEFSQWSNGVQEEGNLEFPCSIAQCDKSGNIAVADHERKQVLLFDSQPEGR